MPQRRPDDNQPFNAKDVQSLINTFQRLPPRTQLVVAVVLIIGGAVLLFVVRSPLPGKPSTGPLGGDPAPATVQMWLGNPSNAGSDRDNYLMVKPYFAVGYDSAKGTPTWVSWRLTAADVGTAPRKQEFDGDATLPEGFVRIVHRDYSGGGFDRGHMCPHGDRSANHDMSYATFVMTNVIPQAANVNQKAWNQCEAYCRDLALHGHRLYITSGPAGRGGTGRNGHVDTIANGRVVVPSDCWKIALILDDIGVDPDPSTITADARVLTIDIPNDQDSVGEEWAQYRTSPADIERRTGLHFFDRLRPDVAETLRQRVDRVPLPPPKEMSHGGE